MLSSWHSLSYCKDNFSLSISPISVLGRQEKKIHRIVFRSNNFFMLMPSVLDLKVHSKGLLFSSKKQQRNYPGQAIPWIWWGIPQLVCPLHYLQGLCTAVVENEPGKLSGVLEFNFTIQRADSGEQTTQSFQILNTLLAPHIRGSKLKEQIIHEIFHHATESNSRSLEQVFSISAISPQNIF